MHKLLKQVFEFPEYYGETWISFKSCFVELLKEPIELFIIGQEILKRTLKEEFIEFKKALKCFLKNNKYKSKLTVIYK